MVSSQQLMHHGLWCSYWPAYGTQSVTGAGEQTSRAAASSSPMYPRLLAFELEGMLTLLLGQLNMELRVLQLDLLLILVRNGT
uniref:Uncharacterized protein n=1 Tax=Picea sitchensis TaxID=3332 RepID=A0A6B9XV95_PICSI|nr:hypothetical protein Q903MT_gene4274 [Picea sitchensis]